MKKILICLISCWISTSAFAGFPSRDGSAPDQPESPPSTPSAPQSSSAAGGGFPGVRGGKVASAEEVRGTLIERFQEILKKEQEALEKNRVGLKTLKKTLLWPRILKTGLSGVSFIILTGASESSMAALILTTLGLAGWQIVKYQREGKAISRANLSKSRREIKDVIKSAEKTLGRKKEILKLIKNAEITPESRTISIGEADSVLDESEAGISTLKDIFSELDAALLNTTQEGYRKNPGKKAVALGIDILKVRAELIEMNIEIVEAALKRLQNVDDQAKRLQAARAQKSGDCGSGIGKLFSQ
jgi:hypothetical protein